jgi:hypothetical protein
MKKILTAIGLILMFSLPSWSAPIYTPGPGTGTGSSSADVTGPSSATDGYLVCFDGATGKILKDCGSGPLTPGVDVMAYIAGSTTGQIYKWDGSAWVASNTLEIATMDLSAANSVIPWPVGTTPDVGLGRAYYHSGTKVFYIGNGTSAIPYCGSANCQIPVSATATADQSGSIAIDTTSDTLIFKGTEAKVIPSIFPMSVVVPSVADTDDYILSDAIYDMTIKGVGCIVSAATNAVVNIQQCTNTTGCVDMLTSNLTCTTTWATTDVFTYKTIAKGKTIKLSTVSTSGTPGTLTVRIRYEVNPD